MTFVLDAFWTERTEPGIPGCEVTSSQLNIDGSNAHSQHSDVAAWLAFVSVYVGLLFDVFLETPVGGELLVKASGVPQIVKPHREGALGEELPDF